MGKSKVKKVKQKTHKTTAKRFKVSGSGKVMHLPQGSGHGSAHNYMTRRQRKARKSVKTETESNKESKKIKQLLGKQSA